VPAATRSTVDIGRLRLAVVLLARRLRHEAETGITPSQLSALASLDRFGPMPLRDLAAVEHVGASTLTRVVAALEQADLIQRVTDPADRRCALVSVTPAGAALLSQARDRGARLLADRVGALPPGDAAKLAEALPVLEQLLEGDR